MSAAARLLLLAALLGALLSALPPLSAAAESEDLAFFRRLLASGLAEPAATQMQEWLTAQAGHPERAEVAHLLGETSLALDRPAAALAAFAAFAELAPADARAPEALFAAGKAGTEAGLLDESAPLLRRLLLDYPAFARRGEALLLAARNAASRGDETLALALLDQLLAADGGGDLAGRALFARAELRTARDPAAAAADFRALRRGQPRHPLAGFAALALAEQAWAAGDEKAAQAELRWVVAEFAGTELAARALALRAELHEAAGRPGAAAADLAARRQLIPAGEADFAHEIDLLIAAGQGVAALALARAEQELVGVSPAGLLRLAEAALAGGEEAAALAALDRAAALDPEGELGRQALERRFALLANAADPASDEELGELEGAARELLARLGEPPARAALLVALGDAAARRRQSGAARRAWEQAGLEAAAGEAAAQALARLARAAERAGDGPQALALYARLLLEQSASPLAPEAARRRELLARYYPADREAALARLLAAMRAQEAAEAGAADEAAWRVGELLLEDFKDFGAALTHFGELAARAGSAAERARCLLAAGRAASAEAERLALAEPQGPAPAAWRARARQELGACLALADSSVAPAARHELNLLALAELPPEADRLPALDALLAAGPPGPALAPYYYERAEQLARRGDGAALARARADAEQALTLAAPDSPLAARVRLAAGQYALALGDSAAARRHFEALAAAGPCAERGEAHFELGRLEAGERHPRRALAHFEAFLDETPASSRAALGRLWMGDCHFRLGAWSEAAASYRALFAAGGAGAEGATADAARYRLALCAEREGGPAAARALLEQVLSAEDPRLRRLAAWRLGSTAAASGRAEEAIALLAQLAGPGARAVEGGLLRGRLLLAARQGEAAVAHYTLLLEDDGVELGDARPEAEAGRIQALLLVGRRQAARDAWAGLEGRATLSQATAAAVLAAFGRERLAAGDGQAAAEHFAACLADYPGTLAAGEAQCELGLLALRSGDWPAARAALAALSACCAGSAASQRLAEQIALQLAAQGDWEGAATHFALCLAENVDPSPELLQDAAQAFERAARPAEALACAERFLAGWPGDPRAPETRLQRGRLLQAAGDLRAAILAYREAELYLLGDAESRARLGFWVGDCLEELGESEAAVSAFLRVGAQFPGQGLWGLTALLRAAALEERAGAVGEAERLYRQVLAAKRRDPEIAAHATAALERLDARAEEP